MWAIVFGDGVMNVAIDIQLARGVEGVMGISRGQVMQLERGVYR